MTVATPNLIMIAVAVLVALITLRPRLIHNPLWRATVTPLASIIGSGFLVAGPILAHAAGNWAWAAMLALTGAAYLFGTAIRRNIRFVEPMLLQGAQAPRAIAVIERLSDFSLSLAYFISVAYYLNLFGSFALRADDIVDPQLTRWLASTVIVIFGAIGTWRGLHALEEIEAGAVGIKLALIGGLLAALAFAASRALAGPGIALHAPQHTHGWHEIGILLGLIVLVQGFETSRYLGDAYDAATRVKTMRYAQWLSTAIYVVFILLVTPFFTERLPLLGGETQIIVMLQPLGAAVAPLIIFAALASQLSAAVADMNGAGGLLASATRSWLSTRIGYLITAAVALGVTWSADIYEIIVYASKAFVLYYGLQCVLATVVALRSGETRSPVHAVLFIGGAVLAVAVLIFGIPAEGGK